MAALLSPSHLAVRDLLPGASPAGNSCYGFGRPVSSQLPEGGGGAVHVAVGKSVEKAVILLQWSFSMFQGHEICILHVHRPSSLIPTLLGKLPASQANPEILAAFRNEERQVTMKLLSNYLTICSRSRVKASVVTIEADEVQTGIVDLIICHDIKKLAIGSIPENEAGTSTTGMTVSASSLCVENLWDPLCSNSASSSRDTSSFSGCTTSKKPVYSVSRAKSVEECLHFQIAELKMEVNELRDEVNLELVQSEKLGAEAIEGISKVKALEAAHSGEVKLRSDSEDALGLTIQEQQKLLEKRDEMICHLQKIMRNISLLESRAQETNIRCEEVSGELKLMQASIATVWKENQKLRRQRNEGMKLVDRWREDKQNGDSNERILTGFTADTSELAEFSLSDLETATCNFSEIFCIGRGGYGTVYKGELVDKTIAVKKLHSYDMQRQTEFHKTKRFIHGNLNPGNILLTSEYRCKISDYGDHTLIASQTLRCPSFRHCTGSSCDFGYTDPEFHRTGMLMHKSDIYSFGLIILQLVTGKMLGGLVVQVRWAVSDGEVASIFDLSAGDWCGYVARRLVELGLQCCGSSGRWDRPEMTPSLVEELEQLSLLEERTVPSFFLCPILQEIMHDPQVAADGFTYEGDALSGWLGNGHETSPMTNLKSSHLNLTPNYALKLAIQDWLRKS